MGRTFFFAGGGTGGHLYPAIAVAERIARLDPAAQIHFLCSQRPVDRQILEKTAFPYTPLPARGFSVRPAALLGFLTSFRKSAKMARARIASSENPAVIGAGGFAAAPAAWAAHRLKIPLALINVDIVPGKANRFVARWAETVFVQFEETKEALARHRDRVRVTGCPLRTDFDDPQPDRAREQLGLDPSRHVLLVTGASTGAQSINQAVGELLPRLEAFAASWQIVHLAGAANLEGVKRQYAQARISHRVLGYFDRMADLYAAADLLVGRSGAVSVAEYAACGVPAICMPYPHHRDRQQILNAGKLVEAGAAVIVEDVPDPTQRAEKLWAELERLLRDDDKRREMARAGKRIGRTDAAEKIAKSLLERHR